MRPASEPARSAHEPGSSASSSSRPRRQASSSRTCASCGCPTGRTPTTWCVKRPTRRERIAAAKPIVEYLIGHHAERFDLKTSSGRIGFVEAVMPTLRDIADPPPGRGTAGSPPRERVEERVLRQVLDRRLAAAPGRERDGRITPTRCWRHRMHCRWATSCARSRRRKRTCCGCSCSSRTSRSVSPTSSARPAPEHRRARAVPGDRHPARPRRPRRSAGVRLGRLLRGLDDETVALAQALGRGRTGSADAERHPARLRDRPTAHRARGRPAPPAERVQQGRPGRGRAADDREAIPGSCSNEEPSTRRVDRSIGVANKPDS